MKPGKPLLNIEQLSVSFASNPDNRVVDEVSFTIHQGETMALVGESGSGKSLTALSVLQLLPYPQARHPSGAIWFDGQDVMQMDDASLRQLRGSKISMIFQEPMTSLNPLHTVHKQIGESLLLHQQIPLRKSRDRVLELLELVGIPEPQTRLSSYPHELSGGQRQRIMIAMALINNPQLLIADEPTTALDVTIQRQILDLLIELQQEMGMAILLISHDLNVVRHYSDSVGVMQQGKLVEHASCQQLFADPQHDYTRHLLAAEPEGSPLTTPANAGPILALDRLKVWFPIKKGILQRTVDHHKAVREATLELREGETLGIVGESGSGKTTLALGMLRLIESQGKILFEGQRLDLLSPRQVRPLRPQLQIVFQDPFGSLSPRMLVGDIICEGLDAHAKLGEAERNKRLAAALQDVDLPADSAERYPHEFSGGQRQRIAIARALILRPKLLVLDEPTSALDRTVQKQIIDLLRQLQQRYGISYLFISHDLAVVRAISHRIIVMRHGDIVEQGSCRQIFEQPEQEYTRTLMDAALLSSGSDSQPLADAKPINSQ